VSIGHIGIGDVSFFGSMHVPSAHNRGVSTGHPFASGHVVSSGKHEPSGHKRVLTPHYSTCTFEQLSFTHEPSSHLIG
jgi:hypothetical protein